MVEEVCRHRADQANIVSDRRGVREQLRNLHTALTMFLELSFRATQRRFRLDKGVALVTDDRFRNWLTVELVKLRLEIEKIQLAGTTGHTQKQHPLCFGGELRLPRHHRVNGIREKTFIEKRTESDRPNAAPAILKKVTPRDVFQGLSL